MKKIAFVTILLALTACKSFNLFGEPQCYWEKNYQSEHKWILAEEVMGDKYNKSSCYAADSCHGGLGQSGGGCYKWSVGPNGKAIAWDN